MKTKITFIIALLMVCFGTNAQSKVGTVDSDYVISKMPQLKTVQSRIKSYGQRLDSINNKKVKDYDAKVKFFNDGVKTLADSIKKVKYAEIAALNQDIAKFRKNGAQMMQLRNDEFMRPLYKKASEVIQQVAKENGYTQILTIGGNDLAYIDLKYDITKLVLAKLGIKE